MGKTEFHQRIGRKIEALVICVNYGIFKNNIALK